MNIKAELFILKHTLDILKKEYDIFSNEDVDYTYLIDDILDSNSLILKSLRDDRYADFQDSIRNMEELIKEVEIRSNRSF